MVSDYPWAVIYGVVAGYRNRIELPCVGTPYTRIGLGRNAPRGSGLVACTKACGHLA